MVSLEPTEDYLAYLLAVVTKFVLSILHPFILPSSPEYQGLKLES